METTSDTKKADKTAVESVQEVGPAASSAVTLPSTLSVQADKLLGTDFKILNGETGAPLFFVTCDAGGPGKLVLHAGPSSDTAPLATVHDQGTRNDVDITIHAPSSPGAADDIVHIVYKPSVTGYGTHCFSTRVAGAGAAADDDETAFEWRSDDTASWKDWKLRVVSGRDAQQPPVVVAARLSFDTMSKRNATFELVGPGATGEMGGRFGLVAVATGLRVWDVLRRDKGVAGSDVVKAGLLCVVS